jgi:hypothetical protein
LLQRFLLLMASSIDILKGIKGDLQLSVCWPFFCQFCCYVNTVSISGPMESMKKWLTF